MSTVTTNLDNMNVSTTNMVPEDNILQNAIEANPVSAQMIMVYREYSDFDIYDKYGNIPADTLETLIKESLLSDLAHQLHERNCVEYTRKTDIVLGEEVHTFRARIYAATSDEVQWIRKNVK